VKKAELTKMCVGGNQKAREYLESQSDYQPTWTLREKYTSRAATALREEVLVDGTVVECTEYKEPF